MPSRSRSSTFARRLEAADQPMYVVDEERWLVAANAACAGWTGWEPERLLTLRCSFHTRPAVGAETDWAAALCPPPEAFDGQSIAGEIAWLNAEGQLHRRAAQFMPLTSGGHVRGVLTTVGDEIAVEPAAAAASGVETDPHQLHAALQRWRATVWGRFAPARLAGASAAAQRVCQQVAAARQAPGAAVLICGPCGSGRQQVGRCIAAVRGEAAEAGFTVIDCPTADTESVRRAFGSFSGQQPAAATVLLSEVDLLAVEVQHSLANGAWPAGVRPIATARMPLVALAARGEFDVDLAQRLSVIVIELVPLANRLVDLPQLAQALVEDLNAVGDKQLAGVTPEALERLALHAWPGDLDELGRVLQAAYESAEGRYVTLRDLPADLELARQAAQHRRPATGASQTLEQTLETTERELIAAAMMQARGNRTKAARALGLSRPRLYRRMVQLGLEPARPGDDAAPDFEEQN